MKKKNIFNKLAFPLILLILVLIIAIQNVESGTYLLGWDSLHPEFNFSLAIKRAFFGVWRPEQGLGALAIHSHMADLPRTIIFWILGVFVKTSFIRYLFFFSTLFIGPLGLYVFVKKNIFIKRGSGLAALAASVFYLLNPYILQHFFVPFEMFAVQFAFLPWLFHFAVRYVKSFQKRYLYWFFVASILAFPMAYAATLFYAYLAFLVLFLYSYWFLGSTRKVAELKKVIVLVAITLMVNAFWLLPNIYSISKNSKVVSDAKINQLFSAEAFLRNQEYGDLQNILNQKNFLFSWRVYDFETTKFVDLFQGWEGHLSQKNVQSILYGFTALALLGLAVSLARKNRIGISLIPSLLLSLFFLINNNLPTGIIYSSLYKNISIFREGLRMPFTKFSIIYIFIFSIFIGLSLEFIFDFLSKIKLTKHVTKVITLLLVSASCYLMLPAFNGELISDIVKTKLPNDYSDVFNWFDDNSQGRIAKFPMHSLWGWRYNDWQYEGSGFEWYGIENPILDRDFDRWSQENESFYNQASFGLYSKNRQIFESVLKKYGVKYLLVDDSVINAGGSESLLYQTELKEMLSDLGSVQRVAQFGDLSIYATNFVETSEYYVPETYSLVNIDNAYSRVDYAFLENGTYTSDADGLEYVFGSLNSLSKPKTEFLDGRIRITSSPLNFSNKKDIGELGSEISWAVPKETSTLEVEFLIKFYLKEDFRLPSRLKPAQNCDLKKLGQVSKEFNNGGLVYKAENGGVSCDSFYYPDLEHNKGYLLRITGENLDGRGLKIYLQNAVTGKMELEELLPESDFDETFFVLPKSQGLKGYSLNFETRAFGKVGSSNRIDSIEIVEAPINILSLMKLVPEGRYRFTNNLRIIAAKSINSSLLNLTTNGEGLMVYNQAFDEGWQAYAMSSSSSVIQNFLPWFFGEELEHVKVNSWANGWQVLAGDNQIVIVYWPQYLEYLGFILLLIILIWLLVDKKRSKRLQYKRV